ncbi:hypothetical protein BG74_08270 [Sodalis-like endosymbiont of Proechinophthirus fluctus]|nr:hypothetical protein BG74_08270 [Sodalis-like endosymbiont of Proechinophthirus fluctus]
MFQFARLILACCRRNVICNRSHRKHDDASMLFCSLISIVKPNCAPALSIMPQLLSIVMAGQLLQTNGRGCN